MGCRPWKSALVANIVMVVVRRVEAVSELSCAFRREGAGGGRRWSQAVKACFQSCAQEAVNRAWTVSEGDLKVRVSEGQRNRIERGVVVEESLMINIAVSSSSEAEAAAYQ